jgi:hypothetical protein
MPPLSSIETPPNHTTWTIQDEGQLPFADQPSHGPIDAITITPITTAAPTTKTTKTTTVRFQDEPHIVEIPRLSEEEKIACWMKRVDYLNIRRECVRIIQMSLVLSIGEGAAAAGRSPIDLRGLEQKTPSGLHRRHVNKSGAIKTVLEEQTFQLQRGFSDPEWIAAKYKESVHRCSIEAKIVGVRDELAIKEDVLPVMFKAHGLCAMKHYSSRMEI